MTHDIPTIDLDAQASPRSISPTDVSQFIRLDQCQRYLRLRLHERENGLAFMREQGMEPQTMPLSLTRSGADFEALIESEIERACPWKKFSATGWIAGSDPHDNLAVVEAARTLSPGAMLVLGQPRLEAQLGPWRLVGVVDLIRLECKPDGTLTLVIVDMKSSAAPRVEHRLQVAFYEAMLAEVLRKANVPHAPIDLGVLYRGPAHVNQSGMSPDELAELERHRQASFDVFSINAGYLEIVDDRRAYIDSAGDLILGEQSLALRVLETEFDQIPFHLTSKCDGCLYNEFCMRKASETDDLSLIPHIAEGDKAALIRAGVSTVTELALLKDLRRGTPVAEGQSRPAERLVPAAGREDLARKLSTMWPVGGRVDELIHRARRYRRFKGDQIDTVWDIPGRGYGSLPYSSADQNPNLVRVFIDVQHDYLNDRVYLLGALIVCNEHGQPSSDLRRSVVRLAPTPPTVDQIEHDLIVDWVQETLHAIVELAVPNQLGERKAPIHLIFVDAISQKALLDALGRHATDVLGATALYDFVTQLAAFTSPIATYLETQIREHKNYPMVCQSLQAVAAYLKFDWNSPEPYRELFKTRLFDFWGKHDTNNYEAPGTSKWFTNHARFSSQIPLEYALEAWNEMPKAPPPEETDPGEFKGISPELLCGFQARRLEAMEHVASDFRGNEKTELSPFSLPDLSQFEDKATSLAHALDEFTTIEQHVELAAWKNERLAEPEERAIRGQTLILRYEESDQMPGIAERNRDNHSRRELDLALIGALKDLDPKATRKKYTKEQKDSVRWSHEGMDFRLRVDMSNLHCDLDQLLRLSTLKPDNLYIIYPRRVKDGRRPADGQEAFTPTAKQMLYGVRANLKRFEVTRDEDQRAVEAFAILTLSPTHGGGNKGFVYNTIDERPLEPGGVYTLDPDPNNWMGERASTVSKGLIEGGTNRLYSLLNADDRPEIDRPEAFTSGQARFLAGLDALHAVGALHDFEESKREFIGGHSGAPVLLVQGPPGTGKSYSTAFALLARLQGAMAAGMPYRVMLSCKTHSATDVLLHNLRDVQEKMKTFARRFPDIFHKYFDSRLLDLPVYRYRPQLDFQPGIKQLPRDKERIPGSPRAVESIDASQWCVAAATPGGLYTLVKDQWPKALFGQQLVQCLVLDEASQMNIPEGVLAALPLASDGQLIVVGDHRQMPPIIRNDWSNEARRTFKEYRSYESLFLALQPVASAVIRFAESFRLHADMAEFLRREVYRHDGIDYHSNRDDVIERHELGDSFLSAVLNPLHPLTVVVHDESESQVINDYEQKLLAPILSTLADPALFNLRPDLGLGVVVPHRAQRAALQETSPDLNMYDDHGELILSAVDTVERFQGGERTVILIGATESDRDYLLAAGKFLLDPRRLTVALSRAKKKLVLVAARSVFELFSADEETFANAQLWKNLLRQTCTVPLWDGDRHGVRVEVWGNPSGKLTGGDGEPPA